MFLIITIGLFCIFILFHILYIFVPLYTLRQQAYGHPSKEKGISILIPAYNEALVIENCLVGIKNLNYTNFEVLFINDGSTDDTLEIFHKHLRLIKTPRFNSGLLNYEKVKNIYHSQKYTNIWIIDKSNGGKADALNAGIDFAIKEIVITLDADSILEENSLNEMNRIFSDESVIAAGGLVKVVQGFKHSDEKLTPFFKIPGIIRYQVVQYLTAFYLHKTTQSKLGSITVIAGAFGAFQRSILNQIKGFRQTVGEDMDITLRIHELISTCLKNKRIVFVPEAVCYTECPSSFKSLYTQRIRWQKGFMDCIITYRKSLYRKMNFKVSTYLLLDSLLLGTLSAFPTLMIPILIFFSLNHIKFFLILFIISFVLVIMQVIASLLVSKRFGHSYSLKDKFLLFLFLPFEVILYRLTELFFVSIGTILYFFKKDGWNPSERIGQPIILNTRVEINIKDTLGG
ncbi:MAG: glycosyltransferase family 2 protein [Solibacillus sp.]